MKTRTLGSTGLEVTEFCAGLLPMGPAQLDLDPDHCAAILRCAYEQGVRFFDTARGYRTEPFLKPGLGRGLDSAVIATKSGARDDRKMGEDVETSLRQIGRDYVDIYHLHAAVEPDPFKERAAALERLKKFKEEGVIKAVGIATHYVSVVNAAAERDDIDVVFPLINLTGMGIVDGTREEMEAAVRKAANSGLGVYGMKPLAGGNLLDRFQEAMDYMRGVFGLSSIALGVVSEEEVRFNARLFRDQAISEGEFTARSGKSKKFIVIGRCSGCGACIKACPSDAIAVRGGKAEISEATCIRCGYCALECPDFCIRAV